MIQHKTMSIVANNLPHGMRSATLATVVSGLQLCHLASDRYDTDRADRSADQQIAFVPLLASNSQRYLSRVLGLFPDGSRHPRSSHRRSPEPERPMFFGTWTVK